MLATELLRNSDTQVVHLMYACGCQVMQKIVLQKPTY